MANRSEAAQRLYDALEQTKIPDYMWDGLVGYITEGRPTGGFLQAILTNDLKGACRAADDANQVALYDYVFFLFNNAPVACWGSPERVAQWREIVKLTQPVKESLQCDQRPFGLRCGLAYGHDGPCSLPDDMVKGAGR